MGSTDGKSSAPADAAAIKIVGLFKRKQGISVQEFRDYYENHHVKLFDQHVALPGVQRYARRYLTPFGGLATPTAVARDTYDVIMEVWYSDRETFESFRDSQDHVFREMIVKDEANFLDRASMLMFTSEDTDSKEVVCTFK